MNRKAGATKPEQGIGAMNEKESKHAACDHPAGDAHGDPGCRPDGGGDSCRDRVLVRMDREMSLSPELQALLDAGRQVTRAMYSQTR